MLGFIAQNSWLFFVAPIVLRASGSDGGPFVFAASALATVAAVVPAGRLVDRRPRRWGLRVGLGLLAASYVPVLASTTVEAAVLASLVSGAGLAFLFVAFNSYVADLMSARERAGAYGASGAVAILFASAGPFAGALVFATTPTESMGIVVSSIAFACAALLGLAVSLLLPSARTEETASAAPSPPGARRTVLAVSVMYAILGASYGVAMPYFSVHFLERQVLASEAWGVLLAAGTIASAAGFYLAGRLASARAPAVVLFVGQAGALILSFAFLDGVPLLAQEIAYPLRLVGSYLFGPIVSAMMMARVGVHERGAAVAWTALAWNLAWAGGALAGGPLLDAWGGWVFVLGGALGVLGVVVGTRLLREQAS